MKTSKAILVGLGRISSKHIDAMKLSNLDIISFVESDNLKIQQFSDSKNKIYKSFYDLVDVNYKDAIVAICTDSSEHFRIAHFFISNGFSVLIEKPVALSLEEIDILIDLSINMSIKVSVCTKELIL
jgi:predicted dehydrogenase